MLRISREQIQVFERLSRQSFVEEMIEHLREFTPVHAWSLHPADLRSIIELGIQRARSRGFTQRGPVRLYIEIMFILGSDFDSDPQFPWAATILDPTHADEYQLDRARELYRSINGYLDAAVGHGSKYTLEALQRAQTAELIPVFSSHADVDQQILRKFLALWPEKSRCVGEQQLRELVRHGRSMAETHGARTSAEETFIVLLMFALGHGCLTDRQFPWIAASLSESDVSGDGNKFVRLRNTSMNYLQKAIKNLKQRSGSQPTLERLGARP